jgi:hypothetical protein
MLKTTHVCKVLKATGNETRMYSATSRMRVECLALSIAFVASESLSDDSLASLVRIVPAAPRHSPSDIGVALRLTTNPPYSSKRREAKRRFDFYLI